MQQRRKLLLRLCMLVIARWRSLMFPSPSCKLPFLRARSSHLPWPLALQGCMWSALDGGKLEVMSSTDSPAHLNA
ncbi:hypothetical protein GE09DRAFT_449738 [Coniochaeta sp. 2T2.1]|nr:hypothetical protein GE09DRAFT_449738 [Coniochaeta sp. 2T2.1]